MRAVLVYTLPQTYVKGEKAKMITELCALRSNKEFKPSSHFQVPAQPGTWQVLHDTMEAHWVPWPNWTLEVRDTESNSNLGFLN